MLTILPRLLKLSAIKTSAVVAKIIKYVSWIIKGPFIWLCFNKIRFFMSSENAFVGQFLVLLQEGGFFALSI